MGSCRRGLRSFFPRKSSALVGCNFVIFSPTQGQRTARFQRIERLFHFAHLSLVIWISNIERLYFVFRPKPPQTKPIPTNPTKQSNTPRPSLSSNSVFCKSSKLCNNCASFIQNQAAVFAWSAQAEGFFFFTQMGASGKWVKAFIGLKKPDKDDHVKLQSSQYLQVQLFSTLLV